MQFHKNVEEELILSSKPIKFFPSLLGRLIVDYIVGSLPLFPLPKYFVIIRSLTYLTKGRHLHLHLTAKHKDKQMKICNSLFRNLKMINLTNALFFLKKVDKHTLL